MFEQILNNSYLVGAGVFVLSLLIFWIIFIVLISYLKKLALKTKTDIDDTLIRIVKSIKPPFYIFLALYLGFQFVDLHSIFYKIITAVLLIWIVYQVVLVAQILADYIVRRKIHTDSDDKAKGAVDLLNMIIKIVLWSLGLLLILSNLGVDVTSLIAGLGIGGIAVAFALQNILGDLFNSFAIYFDKPFEVGDFIAVGDKSGVVEKIGIKTTRVKALQGEEIVFSNTNLTSAEIHNFKKLDERRKAFSVGVSYDTSKEKLVKIPKIIENVVNNISGARFDRAHFSQFGDFSLNFEVVYYILSAEYLDFMNVQQDINLGIVEEFEKEKIEIAFPTQTLHIVKK